MGDDPTSPKLPWVAPLPNGASDKQELAHLVESRTADDFETELYEAAADPLHVQIERDQRRYRGQFLRRMRRHRF